MPITKPVVFLSSTSKDLTEYRDAAARAARQAGFHAEMMEDFEAQSLKPPYAACMEKVRGCDVLVVIVAHRYGWVPPDQPDGLAKSITWLECEEIRQDGREVLAYVVDPAHPWKAELKEAYRATEALLRGDFSSMGEIARDVKSLAAFKDWLNSLGFRRLFTTPESLNSLVQRTSPNGSSDTPTSKSPSRTTPPNTCASFASRPAGSTSRGSRWARARRTASPSTTSTFPSPPPAASAGPSCSTRPWFTRIW
jgi:hypothetical protein